jgi:hypothetical protein
MKYMLIFGSTTEGSEAWANAPAEVKAEGYAKVTDWFAKNGSKIVHTDELQPPSTATTVRHDNGSTIVTDGPFIEAKETIGGYAVVDVDDLDGALELAKTWPPGGSVEVRPVVSRER